MKKWPVLAVAAVAVFAAAGHRAPAGTAAAEAVAYAQAQIGKPYQWGAAGPGAFDCSGLTMMAYQAAGITLPHYAASQYADGPQVSTPQPGDLVFFAGIAAGTPASPGHVGIVTGPHEMIDAYATGTDVRQETFGEPGSAPGLQDPVGYTQPWGT